MRAVRWASASIRWPPRLNCTTSSPAGARCSGSTRPSRRHCSSSRRTRRWTRPPSKTEELQRMRASFEGGTVDDIAFVAEIDRRWKLVRGTKLAAYGDAFIFVEQDTASNKELMAQFKTDGCRVILREKARVYFSTSRLQGGDNQSATNAGTTTKEDSTKTDAAAVPAVEAARKPADTGGDAAGKQADKADGDDAPAHDAPEPTAEDKQKLLADAAERRAA
eukprot:7379894-Prymnesium_polylepis.1